mgnify:CR=1 FL=1
MRNSISVSSMDPDRVQRTGCCVTSRPGILAPGLRSLMKFPLPRMLMTRLSSCSRARACAGSCGVTSIVQGQLRFGGKLAARRIHAVLYHGIQAVILLLHCFNFFAFSDNTSASIGSPFLCGCVTILAVSQIWLYHKNIQVLIQHHNSQRLICQ